MSRETQVLEENAASTSESHPRNSVASTDSGARKEADSPAWWNDWSTHNWAVVAVAFIAALAACYQCVVATRSVGVALDGFTKAQQDATRLNESLVLQQWQQVTIFNIVRKTGAKGIAFDELLEKYRGEATAYPDLDIPKSVMTRDRLQFLLLQMIEQNKVNYVDPDKYIAPMSIVDTFAQKSVLLDEAKLIALTILQSESGKYSMEEFVERLKADKSMPPDVALAAVVELVVAKAVTTDMNGKLWNLTKSPG